MSTLESELSVAGGPKPLKPRTAPPPPPPPEAARTTESPYEPQGERPEPAVRSALSGDMPTGTGVAMLGINGEVEPFFVPGFTRTPFGAMSQKLAAEERLGYHRHWFNDPLDKPGRIEEAYNAGYTHVRDKNRRPIVRTVGRGGLKAYLMEIPEHMWLADMTAQERVNQRIESAIRGGKLSRDPDDDTRYVPRGAIRFEDE